MAWFASRVSDVSKPAVSTSHSRNAGTRGWRSRLASLLAPTANDLPRLRVLLAFPALLLIAGVILISLSLNGSSSGAFRQFVETSADPDLIAGNPQMIRTDEWNVQTVWAIAQVEQGLPLVNETFPGGMDTTVPQDLPRADWTTAFRPHLIGFNLFGVDHAIAWKWWVPALSLLAAAYCFVVTVIPRRPFTAAALAVGFYCSPLFQWWFLATTLWPAVWGLVALTALAWVSKSSKKTGGWVWAGITGYLTVVMAMGIYVPYIIPVVLVVAFYAVGLAVAALRGGTSWRTTLGRFVPILVGGGIGSLITLWWLYTKIATVDAFLNTAYPGERLTPTGEGNLTGLVSAFASSFTQALNFGGLLGQNSSESSTVFFVGVFLIPVVLWIIVRQRRLRGVQPWLLISMVAVVALFAAFLFLPGWDALAHLLLLDRTTANRLRIGIALASFVIVPLIIKYLDDAAAERSRLLAVGNPSASVAIRPGLVLAGGIAVLYLVGQVGIGVVLRSWTPEAFSQSSRWWVYAILGAATLFFVARRRPGLAAGAFAILTIAGTITVNPVYRGVYDLRETDVAKAVIAIDKTEDYSWVGIGDRLTTAVLLESGVRAYNGFQGAPSRAMWDEIDPDGEYEYEWNRLAGISWVPGDGEPIVGNPFADQILVTFDACDDFAQDNVDYVLSDNPGLEGECLLPVEAFEVASGELTIYRVQ